MISLLDRLLEPTERAVVTEPFHTLLCRDIEALLNQTARRIPEHCSPAVAASVINYGLPPLVGQQLDDRCVEGLARHVHTALSRFEPRLDSRSIKVQPQRLSRDEPGICRLTVNARLLLDSGHAARDSRVDLQVSLDTHFGIAHVRDGHSHFPENGRGC
jgi:predicted component of type VI protein secretion system